MGHIATLDAAGTTLGGRFTYAWSRPALGALDLRTTTLIGGVDLQRPLIRSLRLNARTRAGFDIVDQDTRLGNGADAVPLTTDRLRVLFAGLDGNYSKPRFDGGTVFSLTGSIEVRKGLDVLGASDRGRSGATLTSRLDGNAQAVVVRGAGGVMVALNRIFSVAGETQAQWSGSPLLNYEQLSIGNLTIGRGYDPGSNSGDRFVGGHGELRADVPLLTRVGTQLFGFYDYVYLEHLDSGTLEPHRRFRSFGGGGRFSLPGRLVLEVSYAHPQDKVSRLDERRPPNRLLVSLTAQFRGRVK